VQFLYDTHDQTKATMLNGELAALRRAGELADFSDHELLSVNLVAVWRKDTQAA